MGNPNQLKPITDSINLFRFFASLRLLLILSVLPSFLYAQDLISLYKDHLPSEIIENPELSSSINANLKAKAKIHPELIYNNIEQLKNLFLNNKKNQKEVNNYLNQQEKYYLRRRSEWAIKQIKLLTEEIDDSKILKMSSDFFNELIIDSTNHTSNMDSPFNVDNNLMSFFVYLYLTRDNSLVYNSSTDYNKLCITPQHKVLNNYENLYSSIDKSDNTVSENEINGILNNWFMYDDEYVVNNYPDQFTDAYMIVSKILEHNYSAKRQPQFSVSLGYCINNSTFTLSQEYPVSFQEYFSYSPKTSALKNPVKDLKLSTPQLVGAVGYKIFIRENVGLFSYINFQIMASVNAGEVKSNELFEENKTSQINNFDISQEETLTLENVLNTMNSYAIKIGIPVFVIGRSMFFEANLNAGLHYVSSSIDYRFNMTKTEGYYTGSFMNSYYYTNEIASGYGKGKIEINDNYFFIYPTFDIQYAVDSGFRFNVSANHKYMALLCGYSF